MLATDVKIARDSNDLALRKALEEKEGLDELVSDARNAHAADRLRSIMGIWEERQGLLVKEKDALEKNHEMKIAMKGFWLQDERCACEEQIRRLKDIAKAAGVDEKDIE